MIVLVIVSKYLLRFCTESRAKYGEMQAGSGVVFAYLSHCVPETFFIQFGQTMLNTLHMCARTQVTS